VLYIIQYLLISTCVVDVIVAVVVVVVVVIDWLAGAGVLYMKNMMMHFWEESDEAKPSDPPAFIIHENDKQIIRDNLVEAVIAASSPIRSVFCLRR